MLSIIKKMAIHCKISDKLSGCGTECPYNDLCDYFHKAPRDIDTKTLEKIINKTNKDAKRWK